MIDGEEQEILLNTLAETPQEEVHTIEEDIYVIGVESLNGQAGDLTLKSINGENLVGEGNIALQTPLNQAQLNAVNSGIDSAKVGQIATNASNITTLQNTKQDNLTQAQLNAVNSGIDQTKVAQIATNTGNITSVTNRVTTIEGKIPSAASSSNKLTDKNYVDNAIATNTANYISDNGQPFQSYADLVAYSGPLTNNDYAFVETIDQAGNDIYTRYKYNADQNLWAEEYTITNPYFTSDQWASINSGIAANDVAQIGTNKTDIATLQTSKQDKLTTAQQAAVDSGIDATKVQQIATNTTNIATKQDKLIAGTNIQIATDGKTISATDTKYTAGTGLTLTGTQFSVTEPVPSGFFTDTTTSQTSEGTDLTINGTTEAPLKNVELKGDTFQQTYSGKNLIPPTGIHNGAFINYSQLENDNYTETSNTKYRSIKIENLPAGTYTFSINWNYTAYIIRYATGGEVIQLGRNGNTFTLTTTTSGLFGINFRTTTSAEFTDDEYTVQLEAGSTATDYEKFVGGSPSPNPDYPQDIQVVTGEQTVNVTGKNLLPSTVDWEQTLNGLTVKYEDGIYTFSGTSTANGSTTAHNSVAPYTIRTGDYFHYCNSFVSANINIQIFFTDGTNFATSMNSANRIIPIYNYNGTSYVGRTISSYRVNFSRGNTFNGTAKPMILHNVSTATTYEPYQGQAFPISLGTTELCGIGKKPDGTYTYQDYIWEDGDTWKVHKAVGKVVLDGGESSWAVYPTGGVNASQVTIADIIVVSNTTTALSGYSNNFTPATQSYLYANDVACISPRANQSAVVFKNPAITTLADFKTWLSSHNTTVYYALATPTDTAITDETLIAQLEALWNATSYNPQTNIVSTTPAPNLPAILTIDTFKNNWAGTLAGYQETIKRLEARVEELEA